MEKVLQKLKRGFSNEFLLAEKYYTLLFVLNDIHLTKGEINLVAFTAIRGTISYFNIREEFCEKHKTSDSTIYNIISKLKRKGIFIKEGTKIKVNPVIRLSFNKDVTLLINLIHETTNPIS